MAVTERVNSLRYLVRPALVLKYLGQLGLRMAVARLLPVAVDACSGQRGFAQRRLIATLMLGVCGDNQPNGHGWSA